VPPMQLGHLWALVRVLLVHAELRCAASHMQLPPSYQVCSTNYLCDSYVPLPPLEHPWQPKKSKNAFQDQQAVQVCVVQV
jgi:hypothetical protein